MLTQLIAAFTLFALMGFRAEAQDTELQRIADALDVSTTKTFQFTATGTDVFPRPEHQPGGGLAAAVRQIHDAGLRLHGGGDARRSRAHGGRDADGWTRGNEPSYW